MRTDRRVWQAIQAGDLVWAEILAAEQVPNLEPAHALAWAAAIAACPTDKHEPLTYVGRRLNSTEAQRGHLRALSAFKDLARAIRDRDDYTLTRMVARLRAAAPDTSRRQLVMALLAFNRCSGEDLPPADEVFGPLAMLMVRER